MVPVVYKSARRAPFLWTCLDPGASPKRRTGPQQRPHKTRNTRHIATRPWRPRPLVRVISPRATAPREPARPVAPPGRPRRAEPPNTTYTQKTTRRPPRATRRARRPSRAARRRPGQGEHAVRREVRDHDLRQLARRDVGVLLLDCRRRRGGCGAGWRARRGGGASSQLQCLMLAVALRWRRLGAGRAAAQLQSIGLAAQWHAQRRPPSGSDDVSSALRQH